MSAIQCTGHGDGQAPHQRDQRVDMEKRSSSKRAAPVEVKAMFDGVAAHSLIMYRLERI